MALRTTKQLTILNDEHLVGALGKPHTICVTGLPRGGTSSVALFLRELGLFMGDAPIGFNHEDKRLQDARHDPAAFEAIVRDYDGRHETWAFKLPVGAKMLSVLAPLLRNPVHIAVMRNPASIARSRLNRQGSSDQRKFLDAFSRFHREWNEFAQVAKGTQIPIILVQYEKVLAEPSDFGRELVETLRVEVAPDVIDRAVSAISADGYQGFSGDADRSSLERVNRKR